MEYPVRMACGCEFEGKAYFSSLYFNGLFEMDLTKKKLEYVLSFGKEKPCYAIHCGCLKFGSEIWFVPQHGRYISVFDTGSNNLEYIEPQFKDRYLSPLDNLPTICYSYGKIDEENFFLLPAAIDAVNIINVKNKHVTVVEGVIEEGEYICCGVYHEGVIHAFTGDGKWRIEIDTNGLSVQRYEWNRVQVSDIHWITEMNIYCAIRANTSDVYLLDAEFKLIKSITYDGSDKNLHRAGSLLVENQSVWLYPWKSKFLEKIQLEDDAREFIELDNELDEEYLLKPVCSANSVIGVAETSPLLIIFDKDTKTFESVSLNFDVLDVKHKLSGTGIGIRGLFWGRDPFTVINEGDIELYDFINMVLSDNNRVGGIEGEL